MVRTDFCFEFSTFLIGANNPGSYKVFARKFYNLGTQFCNRTIRHFVSSVQEKKKQVSFVICVPVVLCDNIGVPFLS